MNFSKIFLILLHTAKVLLKMNEKAYDIDVLADCNDPLYRQVKESLPHGEKLSDYITSINVTVLKK